MTGAANSARLSEIADRIRPLAVASRVYEARRPILANWPTAVDPRIAAALIEAGFERPFSHQAEAMDLALAGKHVCLATETASGKTLAYLVPIASAAAADPRSHALVLYPTKALAWDQFENIGRMSHALGEHGIALTGGKYDGDTDATAKAAIRANKPNIIFTNPDELHFGLLRFHDKWADLFARLRYVVLDELHAYSGFFGSNVALILRRLRQVCRRYGSSPTFIAASATIENAGHHAQAVTGLKHIVLEASGAGMGHREVFLLALPAARTDISTGLATALCHLGLQSIIFCNSRVRVEHLGEQLRDRIGTWLATYRAGYTAQERRETHQRVKSGEVRCLVATNALELGIDIGDLDVCILDGHPGTNSSVWQRLGRVGRSYRRSSLGVVVLGPDPLGEYYHHNPDEFFASKDRPEKVVVTPANHELLRAHLACARIEAGGQPVEPGIFPVGAADVLAEMAPPESVQRAYTGMDIRFIRPPYEIRDVSTDRAVGEIDGNVAHREAHWNAVYLHGERRYRVGRRPGGKKLIECRPEPVAGRITIPQVTVSAELVQAKASFDFSTTGRPAMPFLVGTVHVTETTDGYLERSNEHDWWCRRSLTYPQGIDLTGEGFALVLGAELDQRLDALRVMVNAEMRPLLSTALLHGLGHLLVRALVGSGVAGAGDLVEYAIPYSPELDGPTLYVCESVPGGLGFARELFDNLEGYLAAAHERISRCPCREEQGCPACIFLKFRCPQRNQPLHKRVLSEFLSGLLGVLGSRSAWAPPSPLLPPKRGETWKPGADYRDGAIVIEQNADGVVVRLPSGEPRLLPWS